MSRRKTSDRPALSRRAMLSGQFRQPVEPAPLRPPWTDEAAIAERCTSCGDCTSACPEAILTRRDDGTPQVDFADSACTFCYACAESCDEGVFAPREKIPWGLSVRIGNGCLMDFGISCRLCTDSCLDEALVFDLSQRPVGAIRLNADACTGCGACLSSCPEGAITMAQPVGEAVHV